ncbi:MAG: hypothetical protein AB1384_08040 [Actinomycetota bacterium]
MARAKICPECGVPLSVTKHHTWLPNGTILEDGNLDHRMVFIESESLRDTFSGIEGIMGISIARIIIESQRRSTYDSIDHALPAPVKAIFRYVGTGLISRYIANIGRLTGRGDIEVVSFKRRKGEDDYIKLRIREPFSLSHFSGNFVGAMEAVDGREIEVTYVETAPDEYELTARISGHPLELTERLQRKAPRYKEGDFKLPRCGVCGGPGILADYVWLLDRGVIENRESKRRMVLVSTATQEAIIDELQAELGDSIIQAAMEAQRSLVATGFFSSEEIKGVDDFRTQFAYRGLGNLVEVELDQDHLHFRLENACLHPMVAGLVQGLYERAFGTESEMEWEVTADNDLVAEVSKKS